LTSSYLN
jgi:hypothetical protein